MIEWIIATILIAVLWFFFKARHMRHRFFAIFVVFLLIFLFISGVAVISTHKVDVTTFKGVISAGKIYLSWIGGLFVNGKNIAGNVIKMNWGNVTG